MMQWMDCEVNIQRSVYSVLNHALLLKDSQDSLENIFSTGICLFGF